MTARAPQIHGISLNETRHATVDMRGKLEDDELLTGVPVLTELSTTNLSLTNASISVAALVVNDDDVPIAQAVQFTVSSAAIGRHVVTVRCATNAGQTIEASLQLVVS